MADILIRLGDFGFSMDSLSYNALKRTQSYRWSTQSRLQRRPSQQFIGMGEETIHLSGTVYPDSRARLEGIQKLREMAALGKAYVLVDGLGFVWGQWVVSKVEETQSFFTTNGLPRKQIFTCELKHYGKDTL